MDYYEQVRWAKHKRFWERFAQTIKTNRRIHSICYQIYQKALKLVQETEDYTGANDLMDSCPVYVDPYRLNDENIKRTLSVAEHDIRIVAKRYGLEIYEKPFDILGKK